MGSTEERCNGKGIAGMQEAGGGKDFRSSIKIEEAEAAQKCGQLAKEERVAGCQ